jgi:hypothetical protein
VLGKTKQPEDPELKAVAEAGSAAAKRQRNQKPRSREKGRDNEFIIFVLSSDSEFNQATSVKELAFICEHYLR